MIDHELKLEENHQNLLKVCNDFRSRNQILKETCQNLRNQNNQLKEEVNYQSFLMKNQDSNSTNQLSEDIHKLHYRLETFCKRS